MLMYPQYVLLHKNKLSAVNELGSSISAVTSPKLCPPAPRYIKMELRRRRFPGNVVSFLLFIATRSIFVHVIDRSVREITFSKNALSSTERDSILCCYTGQHTGKSPLFKPVALKI
jgi:hypothetical protein